MAMKQFKAESKRLLDLMINSIYTHKEIFLRELISNASDAIDKLYFRSLSENVGLDRSDFSIHLAPDKEARTLTITDNGCGMTKEEMEQHLGTIAKSGSLAFKKENETGEDVDIIGQFGVGFYSAFMVSDKVTVESRAYGSEEAFRWESKGPDGYTIVPCQMEGRGTRIILSIKANTEDENYDEFLETWRLQELVKKYSDYIRYPITMEVEHSHKKEDSDEYETVRELETLNTMVPLWRKNKSELKQEDYDNFYKEKFHDFEAPLRVIHTKTEGTATYDALLFIPGRAPYDYYSKDYEKGLQLYSGGVLIMDKCADLLPDHFSFVKGLVDSADLSLNISREMLQHDRQLAIIAKNLEKKIGSELKKLLETDREKYEAFWKNFGLQIKFGAYDRFGANKEALKDLLLFHSSLTDKLTTLAEYVSRMKEDQKCIYYAAAGSVAAAARLPQTEQVRQKGYEILYLTDNVDEFALQVLHEYDGKELKSVSDGDLDLSTDAEKEEAKKQAEENKGLLDAVKEALGDKVSEVRLSSRLTTTPACVTSAGGLSLEMERVLAAMPGAEGAPKAQRVLELNPGHPVFAVLSQLADADKDKLAAYADILYQQALLLEGMPLDDPAAYAQRICELMVYKK